MQCGVLGSPAIPRTRWPSEAHRWQVSPRWGRHQGKGLSGRKRRCREHQEVSSISSFWSPWCFNHWNGVPPMVPYCMPTTTLLPIRWSSCHQSDTPTPAHLPSCCSARACGENRAFHHWANWSQLIFWPVPVVLKMCQISGLLVVTSTGLTPSRK